jgi:Zn-dependent membrane protease YugP
MFYFDPMYFVCMAPALILMSIVQWYVSSAYSQYSKVPASSRVSGGEAAHRLINAGGLYGVRIEGISGKMTDQYDPRQKVLRLSRDTYEGRTVASLAVAAHELGHAMQDKDEYFPLRFRAFLVPAVRIGSNLGWVMIFLGIFIGLTQLAWLGIGVFSLGVVFALVTIPVELNASRRAKALLVDSGLIQTQEEQRGVNKVLNAAALTYVAALITAVMQLLYFITLVGGSGRRRS